MQISTATRRVYMSILTIMLVFLTTVATTFAWVGILNYTDTSNFELNLQTENNNKYRLTISATEDGEYSDSANVYDIKKQILVNMGWSDTNLTTPEYIDNMETTIFPLLLEYLELMHSLPYSLNFFLQSENSPK